MDYKLDQRFRRVVDILGLDENDLFYPHVPEKVMFLYDWAEAKAKSTELPDVVRKLEGIRKEMGIMLRGRPLLTDLYKHAKFDAHRLMEQKMKEEARESNEEKESREKEMVKKGKERIKAWQDTIEGFKKERLEKDLENIYKHETQKRMEALTAKQQSQGNIKVKEIINEQKPEEIKI